MFTVSRGRSLDEEEEAMEGKTNITFIFFQGELSLHSSACSIFHGSSFNILFLPLPHCFDLIPINPC